MQQKHAHHNLVFRRVCPAECCIDNTTCDYTPPTTTSTTTTTTVATSTLAAALPTTANDDESPIILILAVAVAVLLVAVAVLVFCVIKARGAKAAEEEGDSTTATAHVLNNVNDSDTPAVLSDQYRPVSTVQSLHDDKQSALVQADSQRDYHQPIDEQQPKQYNSVLSAQAQHQQTHHYEDAGCL